MISAKTAKNLSTSVRKGMHAEHVNENSRLNVYDDAKLMGIINGSIINASKEGYDSCISYLVTPNALRCLTSHGYIVEEEVEDDIKFHVIIWGEDARKIREERWQIKR